MKNNNLIKPSDVKNSFNIEGLKFTLSSRGIEKDMNILDYLRIFYMYIPFKSIESIFGSTTEYSKLYGGRIYQKKYSLDSFHLQTLMDNSIGVSLTLTNHSFDINTYKESLEFLKKHHKKGNSVVCVNDELAKQIRKDFPKYKIKASLIKNLNTLEKVINALTIYDNIVIPMDKNDDDDFLISLPNKDRITLFANANCAYNCTARICYNTISHQNNNTITSSMQACSKDLIPRLDLGHVFFDVKKLSDIGFKNFKLVPNLSEEKTKITKKISNHKNYFFNSILKRKKIFYLYSIPKSGRTWLRFIIASYINKIFNLNIDLNLKNMFSLMPNEEYENIKGILGYDFYENSKFPLIISSHKNISEGINSFPKIILLRNIFEIIVSDYFQQKNRLKIFEGKLCDFIKNTNVLKQYCELLNNYSLFDNSDNTNFFITYENMHLNIYTNIKKLIFFLELPIDDKIIIEAINNGSFENMQKVEIEKGVAGYDLDTINKESLRVREGKINNYNKYLDEKDIFIIKEECSTFLTSSGMSLVKKYKLFE
ncbi:MAG: sulfotransferase domain-containing protein [Halarcobacter sp.]